MAMTTRAARRTEPPARPDRATLHDFFDFMAHVATGGYEVRRAGHTRHVGELPPAWPDAYKVVRPLKDDPTLFRTFSALSRAKDVCDFANRWGLLGLPGVDWEEASETGNPIGERLDAWLTEAKAIKEVWQVWGLIIDRDLPRLNALWRQRFFDKSEAVAQRPDVIAQARAGQPLAAAVLWLSDVVSEKLGHTASRLVPRAGRLDLEVRPVNLLGALWLQLARAVANRAEHRLCVVCGKAMEISSAGYRKNRMYCSSACNVRAFRARRAEAERTAASRKGRRPPPARRREK